MLPINYSTHILFFDLGSQRMKGYTVVWSKHILTRLKNAGRTHSFLTLKIYKVFSKSYRKQTKQALYLLENSTFIGSGNVGFVEGLP